MKATDSTSMGGNSFVAALLPSEYGNGLQTAKTVGVLGAQRPEAATGTANVCLPVYLTMRGGW